MGNMSYCRFQNTLGDLEDCCEAMAEMPNTDDLSPDEKQAMKQLINLCGDIFCDFEGFK